MATTFLKAKWQNLIMANYEIAPELLMPYLPKGVELDYFQGKTYVSLVGFLFKDTALFGIPIPLLGTFEEVNLRFYVVRKIGNEVRRGVVFVNETVPYKIVAQIANKLYKEHYTAIPTKHKWLLSEKEREIVYQMKVNAVWNTIKVVAAAQKVSMQQNSIEEFIFEHYYGYTRASDHYSIEYKVNHPRWDIYPILSHQIHCDFAAFYGPGFSVLNTTQPHSVMLAEGSGVSVDWKRVRF